MLYPLLFPNLQCLTLYQLTEGLLATRKPHPWDRLLC